MTVQELIENLSECDPQAEIRFVCDYGDYHHTQQALPVASVRQMEPPWEVIVESAYSQSQEALVETRPGEEEDREWTDEELEKQNFVLLRMDWN